MSNATPTLTIAESREILGISDDATTVEAKSAWKNLVLEHHPDKNGGSQESHDRFVRITAAWETFDKMHKLPKAAKAAFGGRAPPRFGGPGPARGNNHGYSDSDSDSQDDDEDDYTDADEESDDEYSDYGEDEYTHQYGHSEAYFEFLFNKFFHEARAQGLKTSDFSQSPEARKTRLAAEREAILKAEQRRKEEDRRAKEDRERRREEEMAAGAARRESKKVEKIQQAAAAKAAAAQRVVDQLAAAQARRTKVFAWARQGKSDLVKQGVWEDNVGADGGERLAGFVSAEEREKERREKDGDAEGKENVPQGGGGDKEGGDKEGGGKKQKNKKKKGGAAGGAAAATPGPSTNGPKTNGANGSSTANGAKANGKAPAQPTPNPDATKAPKAANSKKHDDKKTLLHIAAKHGDADLVVWLVDHGATPEERDSAGYTAFHYGLQSGNAVVSSYFLAEHVLYSSAAAAAKASAQPDAAYPLPSGETLLSLAVISGAPEVVQLVVPYSTTEEASDMWGFVDEVQKTGRNNGTEDWEEVKWCLAATEGFNAPSGYQKRQRRRK